MLGIESTAEADGWRIPRPDWFFLWGADAIAVLLVLALFTAIALGFVAARTVYYLDAAEVCAVALLPAEAALLAMTVPSDWWADRLDGFLDKGLGAIVNALAGLFILAVLLPVNVALSVNQWGDRSAGVPQRLLVLDKQERVRKSRHSYTVSVMPEARRPLPKGSSFRIAWFDGPKEVTAPRAEWEKAEPGRSTLTLAVHSGLFGFAWYEDGARLAL